MAGNRRELLENAFHAKPPTNVLGSDFASCHNPATTLPIDPDKAIFCKQSG
jgi:hypothetical protein